MQILPEAECGGQVYGITQPLINKKTCDTALHEIQANNKS